MAVDLPAATPARLSIFDVQGRKVRTVVDGPLSAGRTISVWDGRGDAGQVVGSGVYFARLNCKGHSHTARLVLIR